MRIEQLEHLIEIAKKNSFNSASEALYLTPQSLSRSISRMENELGFKLFERSPQGVRFTEEGEIFLKSARKIVKEYKEALREVYSCHNEITPLTGELIIYANPFFHIEQLPRTLNSFCTENPQVRVTVVEKDPQSVYQRIQRAELEQDAVARLGIVLVPNQEKDFFDGLGKRNSIHFEALKIEPYYVYVSKTSTLAEKEEISIEEVLQLPVVLFSSSEENMTPVRFLAEQYGKLNVVFTASSFNLWLNAIHSGIGIGLFQELCSYASWQNKIDLSQVVKIKLKEEISAVLGCLYWGEPDAIIKEFMKYLSATITI